MNIITLVGQVHDAPYFNRVGRRGQPFMSLYLRLPGPARERPSVARVAVYGQDAESYFPHLRPGIWVAISGRYRVRANDQALTQARERFADLLMQHQVAEPTALSQALVDCVRYPLRNVHEFVALRGQIRLLPLHPSEVRDETAPVEA